MLTSVRNRGRRLAGLIRRTRRRVSFRLRLSLLLLSCCLLPASLPAQDPARIGFRRFTVENGLSQGTVTSILQDHEGFIWVGTLDGLNRFDGIEFLIYRHSPGDSSSLSNSWITALHEDGDGRLWVGTRRGLNEFDRRTETFRRYPAPGPNGVPTLEYDVSMIRSAWNRQSDEVIVNTGRYFSADRSTGTLTRLPPPGKGDFAVGPDPGAPLVWEEGRLYSVIGASHTIRKVLDLGPNHIAWAGGTGVPGSREILLATSGGMMFCDTASGVTSIVKDCPWASTVLPDGWGGFWLSTPDGLWKLEREGSGPGVGLDGWKAVRAGLPGIGIGSLCRDSTGTIWAGSIDGLYRKLTSSPVVAIYRHLPDNPNSLGSNFVMPLMEDREGRIWVGTLDHGVSILTSEGADGPRFRNFPKRPAGGDGPWGNNVRAMIQTRDGAIWVGTEAGLTLVTPEPRFTAVYMRPWPDTRADLYTESFCETRDGTLWAGCSGSSLVRIDRVPGSPPRFVPFILRTGQGETMGSSVNVITEAPDGTLWAGTEEGLFHFDPRSGSVKHFFHDPENVSSLSNSFVWSIATGMKDGRDVLWVGTSQGLNRFDPASGEWTSYFRQEGFPSDWVYGILTDSLGRLWLTTNRGITCFDDGRPEGRKFSNFNTTDGIAGDECNRRSYLRLRNGEFIFGGTNGFTRFNPQHVAENRNAPPVVLTSVLNAGRKMTLATDAGELKELRLGHDQNDIAFEFAALDYANPLKNQYAYMMEGQNREWTYIGNRRYVSYAGLDPGRYVFRVKASNNDGLWNEAGLALNLVIEPPYWESWWFIASAAAVVVFGVVGVFRLREKRVAEIFGIRRRIARDLHDEIGSNLTGIAVSGSLLKDDGALTPEQEGRVADITSIAVRTSELMRDLIWVIRPENDRLDDLCYRMKDSAAGILGGSNCHFAMPPDPSLQVLNLEVKHNLYLIYKEIITNIARHARAKEVTVTLDVAGRSLTLTVADDGAGFDTTGVTKGMGLKNLSARASAIRGSINTTSSPGKGTSTTVVVPLT